MTNAASPHYSYIFEFYFIYFISFAQKNTDNNLHIRAGTPQKLEPIFGIRVMVNWQLSNQAVC